MFLFWADKGRVTNAAGVQVLRGEKTAFEPLASGDELHTGEILVLHAESRLEIKTPEGDFRTPKEGLGPPGNRQYWFVQITGPQALVRDQAHAVKRSHANSIYSRCRTKWGWNSRIKPTGWQWGGGLTDRAESTQGAVRHAGTLQATAADAHVADMGADVAAKPAAAKIVMEVLQAVL